MNLVDCNQHLNKWRRRGICEIRMHIPKCNTESCFNEMGLVICITAILVGFPGGSLVLTCLPVQKPQETWVWSPVRRSPEEGMVTHSVFFPGKSQGQTSLESQDMTERLSMKRSVALLKRYVKYTSKCGTQISKAETPCWGMVEDRWWGGMAGAPGMWPQQPADIRVRLGLLEGTSGSDTVVMLLSLLELH